MQLTSRTQCGVYASSQKEIKHFAWHGAKRDFGHSHQSSILSTMICRPLKVCCIALTVTKLRLDSPIIERLWIFPRKRSRYRGSTPYALCWAALKPLPQHYCHLLNFHYPSKPDTALSICLSLSFQHHSLHSPTHSSSDEFCISSSIVLSADVTHRLCFITWQALALSAQSERNQSSDCQSGAPLTSCIWSKTFQLSASRSCCCTEQVANMSK